jgi:hypothetical protein
MDAVDDAGAEDRVDTATGPEVRTDLRSRRKVDDRGRTVEVFGDANPLACIVE